MSGGNEYDLMVNQIRRDTGISTSELVLNTPLGPISVENLVFIDGWKYENTNRGYPGIQPALVVGGPPFVVEEKNDEQGWIIAASIIFTSPHGLIEINIDNFFPTFTPFLADAVIGVQPLNRTPYQIVYNPSTPFGPLYGMILDTAQPYPYTRFLKLQGSLPAGSPVAACNIFAATLSRIMIQDRPTFYRSLKRFNVEQRIGKRVDRYL